MSLFSKWSKTPHTPEAAPRPENDYGRQMTDADVASGEHRTFIGGMWDEIGALQFEFLKKQGLLPSHRLADIGCGCMRGGIHFAKYLEKRNYYGIDINPSLIEAGKKELADAGCSNKEAQLAVTDRFDLAPFGTKFDYALAISVFTHLYSNHIGLCLKQVRRVLAPDGKLFATFFEAPEPLHLSDLPHQPGGIVTHLDQDPFHYSFSEMSALAGFAGMKATLIGDWGHPRQQRMLCFTGA